MRAGVPLQGASDHGVSEALYLRDPDGNGLELYWDRPRAQWPRNADGSLQMMTGRLDLDALLAVGRLPADAAGPQPQYALMSEQNRARLRAVRGGLLHLHKVLLDDTRVTYAMDRGRI